MTELFRPPTFRDRAELAARLVALRERLHRIPEPSFEEVQTTDHLAAFLSEIGVGDVQRLAGTGLVARVPGRLGSTAPTVALRGDIDALPIHEETGVEYSSERAGWMHACGHDVHGSWAVGAAALLVEEPADGDVLIVLQPGEETGRGAERVVASGLLEDAKVIFGGHVDPRWEVGQIVAQPGPMAAATDEFTIEVRGAGGHGARPQLGRDPIVATAGLVTAIQTIVARRVTPGDPAVVTVGEFHAGTAANVIPETARLTGTMRSTTVATRELLKDALLEICRGIGAGHGVHVDVAFHGGTPPIQNDESASAVARDAAEAIVGEERMVTLTEPNMGGEDFAVYLERMPGCFLRFGSRGAGDPVIGAHTPRFMPRSEVVWVGAAVLAECARRASSVG